MATEVKIISRKDAKAAGLSQFFTGRPCIYGHLAPRNTTSGGCAACAVIRVRAWRAENPDRAKEASSRAYRAKAPLYKARARRWHKENVERAREKARQWAADHRDEMTLYRMASRAKRFGCESDLTLDQLIEVRREQNACRYCQSEANLTFDHIVPLAKRGPNTRANLQVLCKSCNSQKQDTDEIEFLQSRQSA